MDQESFRQLLQKPSAAPPTNSSTHVRGSLLSAASTVASASKKKAKPVDASQPAFKPRTLKKSAKGEAYRDRATERRLGTNNDYAQVRVLFRFSGTLLVEALAEDFERRIAENADRDAVEEQRKYLGGDSQHTVLVKGLDFALLEQNRARAAAEAAVTDDVSLEQAFTESVAQPKKRTREEILRDLKSKRGAGGPSTDQPVAADEAFVDAKKAGKFKPIGFKPIGSNGAADGKVKRKKKAKAGELEENGERKKKRRVVAETAPETAPPEPSASAGPSKEEIIPPARPPTGPSSKPETASEPGPIDEDVDIFADAGEYAGIDLGDDEEGSDDERPALPSDRRRQDEEGGEVRGNSPLRPGKWLATSDDEQEPIPPPPPARQSKSAARSDSPQRRSDGPHRPASDEEKGEMEEEERPVRLQPLSSSVVPSIKDLLAASEEVDKAEKRKARKEKKKVVGGGGASSEKDTKAKVDRDYQRLKAYQDKQNKS
ncbi:RED-like protein N-terminal region-domain-containing protein [Ganoderma leucocontextum]|nr:RED-like protein N-terminal region-domain-containing protein [Ganoderma leucocontextum]